MYKELPSQLNYSDLEKEILVYWETNKIFEKSITSRPAEKPFIFYEGPPTANGRPGIHHVISRTIKDLACRLKTMQGYRVERKAGWDTHGLPVEIAVEKELGITNKEQIEEYGVEKFNRKCQESVWKYKTEWDELTRRIGFWVDLNDPYITYETNYIESVWWILKEIWKKDLLYEGYKITPYCPRCGTPLSSHEVSLGYQDVQDASVYVKMPIEGEENTSFLVWTTTPWTLISNVAIALHPDITYTKVKTRGEYLILAQARLSVLEDDYEIVDEVKGAELLDVKYKPLFNYCQTETKVHYSVGADFVSTEDGSGIVHLAPAFGEDDFRVGQRYDLPVFQPVDRAGCFTDEVTDYKGKFVKTADDEIIKDLRKNGRLYKVENYLHSYPHCWRCSSPLLYYAQKSWFIKTTQVKDRLMQLNDSINWYPKEVGQGRFGEWLRNNVDWSLSRDRYWGTPLPIWICADCGVDHCVGGIEELKSRGGISEINNLHKPYIDRVQLTCEKCGGTMRRVSEVIDVWFDSGSMPVAQWHYPFENEEKFKSFFPADFISEGVDQTRGWFYSLLAIAGLLFDQPCYKSCLSIDLILDKMGKKMSKSKGNTVAPNQILDKYGADALRWYLLTASPPWLPTRFDEEGVKEVLRKFLGTLTNVYSFFVMYANIDGFKYESAETGIDDRIEIDQWLITTRNALVKRVEEYYSRYDVTKAARAISAFVIDDLSNWYVRRCRRRFWKSEMGQDKRAAYETLYETLLTVAKLMAPCAPFMSDEIYLNLSDGWATGESVHLAHMPRSGEPEYAYRDPKLEERMNAVRKVVFLGRSLRNESGVKVRQPLRRVILVVQSESQRSNIEPMAGLIIDELNVKEVDFATDSKSLVTKKAVPKYRQLGPRLGSRTNEVTAKIRELGDKEIAALEASRSLNMELADQTFIVHLDDVEIVSESRKGLAVQSENEWTVALDLEIGENLLNEGLAREFVNRVQNMRKNAGFDVVDRINIYYESSPELLTAVSNEAKYVSNETLAENISDELKLDLATEEWEINGSRATIAIEKVQ